MRGEMLWFNEEDDAGAIRSDDGVRVGVVGADFVDGVRPVGRCAGRPVTFQLAGADDDRRAVEVRLEDAPAARRARLRRSTFR
jgi:hypothetical protein